MIVHNLELNLLRNPTEQKNAIKNIENQFVAANTPFSGNLSQLNKIIISAPKVTTEISESQRRLIESSPPSITSSSPFAKRWNFRHTSATFFRAFEISRLILNFTLQLGNVKKTAQPGKAPVKQQLNKKG